MRCRNRWFPPEAAKKKRFFGVNGYGAINTIRNGARHYFNIVGLGMAVAAVKDGSLRGRPYVIAGQPGATPLLWIVRQKLYDKRLRQVWRLQRRLSGTIKRLLGGCLGCGVSDFHLRGLLR